MVESLAAVESLVTADEGDKLFSLANIIRFPS